MSSTFHPMLSRGGLSSTGGEWAFVGRFRNSLPAAPAGQHWIGDDGAVPDDGLLPKTDILVEGFHFDPGNRGFEHTIAAPAASSGETH